MHKDWSLHLQCQLSAMSKVRGTADTVLVLVYTQEGSLWSLEHSTEVFLRAMVAPGTRTFMCPPRHRAM